MFKANRRFNINVNGFKLLDILDNFGTMCSMSKFCKLCMQDDIYFIN